MDATEQFKALALANGRTVSCRIDVGGKTYYDDRLLKFDLDDVTHPDWFTVGTACPNEFSFSVVYYEVPEVHTMVRPYIRFGGSEWFPLGVFYIARRYIRGKYATFVCYDKMYDLNVELEQNFPASVYSYSDTLLNALCSQAGLSFSGSCAKYPTFRLTGKPTIRQLIGYIAALNCACAKIDRNGTLVFRKYTQMPTARISADNCFNITKNITRAGIGGLRVNTETKTLRYGEYTGLSVIDLYNPFMTQEIVNKLGKQLDPLYFYGAELDMQGLPFLNSGELIQLEDTDGSLTPIAISEIKYHYDGGLTAKLFSKNKNDNDPVVHRKEFEDALEALWEYVRGK